MKHRVLRSLNLALIVVLALAASAAAQSSAPGPRITPEASPSSVSPEVAAEQVGGWTIADRQDIKVDGQPVAISPDAKWIAGIGPDKNFCVWDVAALDATCDDSELAIQPETIVWAPDSSAVAFSLEAAKYFVDSDIYVFDVETGELADLTDDGENGAVGFDMDPGAGPVFLDIYPAWSPDSSQLLFSRTNWNAEKRATTLMTIDRDGGEPELLFTLAPPEPLIIYSPMYWLGDDSIVFSVWHADPDNGQNGIWMRSPSGKMTKVLAGDSTAEVPMPRITSVTGNGRIATVFSAILQAQYGSQGTSKIYFFLDLQTGDVFDVPPTAGQDVTDTRTVDTPVVSLPARLSADDKQVVYSVRQGNGQQLVIADAATGDATFLPFDETFAPVAYFQGLQLAAGNALFMPTNGSGAGTATILTLEPPAAAPTPPPPCSCTPPKGA
ncbi:MAG: hypothetical protein WBA63_13460 [Thermomicrobiales bacterium]